MFRKDGTWKEFGVGRRQEDYTWLPFWLFCVFWALISYIISLIAVKVFTGGNGKAERILETSAETTELVPKFQQPRSTRIRRGSELPEGYYVLSKPVMPGQTPTYVYLGPEA